MHDTAALGCNGYCTPSTQIPVAGTRHSGDRHRGTIPDWSLVFNRLQRTYREGDWRVPLLRPTKGDPFEVLVSTIVSHQTRDEVTAKVSAQLFSRYPDSFALAEADAATVSEILRPAGLAAKKSQALIDLSATLVRDFDGRVPSTMTELVALPSVGAKTANAVLQFAYGRPAITVDAHVTRVVQRLTGTPIRSRLECDAWLREHLPKRYWSQVNPLLVQHGQNLCSAARPACPRCPLQQDCAYSKATRAARRTPTPDGA